MNPYYADTQIDGSTHVVQVLRRGDGGSGDPIIAQFFGPDAKDYAQRVANLLNTSHHNRIWLAGMGLV